VSRRTSFGLVDRGAGVDAERAGVAEGIHLGVDGVGEAAIFADGLEEAELMPPPNIVLSR
jgi:hypothetical protein